MRTTSTPVNASHSLDFFIDSNFVPNSQFYLYMHFVEYGPLSLTYLSSTILYTQSALTSGQYQVSIYKTTNSTHPPILNAIEIYMVKEFLQSETVQKKETSKEIHVLLKHTLGRDLIIAITVTIHLQSYPCKNLSSSGLTEEIPLYIANLTHVEGNSNLCASLSCEKKKKKTIVVPIAASVASFTVLIITFATLWRLKKRKPPLGFGIVFHGYLDDTQVTVKMLSHSSIQGYRQFQAEVELLLRVNHRNLTSLIMYCKEGINMGLIYEYMTKGNLAEHLSMNQYKKLKNARLEYLHNGCKPSIIHRDMKCTNILLNENLQAKLADFGLSKTFPIEGGTHVSAFIIGTPSYLDLEQHYLVAMIFGFKPSYMYYTSNRLTEKSDVYSFGIVLLEIIIGRLVILEINNERTHISQWVGSMLSRGDIKNIVDPRLQGDFDVNSIWKAVEVAMTSVSPSSTRRPTMT
ncbi:Protein kinase domain - like 10 [Theobroma cacao]|nr:Protein kinase domain - like 10 [Theobroma cacao]